MPEDADRAGDGTRLRVAVVVVNYRTKELTATAVRSVLGDPVVDEVVVVDNGSGDGSPSFLRSALPDSAVRIVESGSNLGFGRGANLGVSSSQAPLVLLLNSDATVRPGSLAMLARVLAETPDVGVVAPAVYLGDGHTLQPDAYGPLPAPGALLRTVASRHRVRRVPRDGPPGWVSGVAMMVRRGDFLALGGFDPEFTMYFEDVDLCRRFQAIGKRVVREPAASVVHLGGASSTGGEARRNQFHRSKAVYLRKVGATPLQLHCAGALRILRAAVERLRAGGRRTRG